jgi:dihydrofolate reductase
VARVIYHVTMSLDGFIAGPGDDMTWLRGLIGGPNPAADELIGRIGALLIGANTYRPATSATGKPYGGAWTGPMFVLTHDEPEQPEQPQQPDEAGFTFLSGDLPTAVATARAAAGDDDRYLVIFGATTAKRCLEAGLLDEILVHIAPVLLGDGVRFFDRPGGPPTDLEWVSRSESAGVTNLWLRVPEPGQGQGQGQRR